MQFWRTERITKNVVPWCIIYDLDSENNSSDVPYTRNYCPCWGFFTRLQPRKAQSVPEYALSETGRTDANLCWSVLAFHGCWSLLLLRDPPTFFIPIIVHSRTFWVWCFSPFLRWFLFLINHVSESLQMSDDGTWPVIWDDKCSWNTVNPMTNPCEVYSESDNTGKATEEKEAQEAFEVELAWFYLGIILTATTRC